MVDVEKTLYDLCEPLVEDKASLQVKRLSSADDDSRHVVLCVYASDADVARLIGRKGQMAASLRQMVSIATRSDKVRVSVKFEAY